MKSILIVGFAAAGALFAPMASAANLEFVVPAPVNLMLTISGHGSDGAQLFSQTTNQVVMQGDQPTYIVRVEDSVVAGKLGRWCVLDRTRTWAELPGSEACIDAPIQSDGAYTFDIAMAQPAKPVEPAPVALSDEEKTSCVQAALNALGFDAGAVDGQLGNGTRRAFAAFAASTNGKVNERWQLNGGTLGALCLYLAREHELDADTEALAVRQAATTEIAFAIGLPPEAFAAFAMADEKDSAVARLETYEEYTNPADGKQMLGLSFAYPEVSASARACTFVKEGWVLKNKEGKGFRGSCTPLDPALATAGRLTIVYTAERGQPG